MQVRELRPDELDAALDLVRAEGWTFDRTEFGRLLRLGTCLVVDDGTVRGLATIVAYPGLAWIGNVVVTPALRGKGAGERLVRACVDRARADGAATVALYSVPKAVGLYARIGFRGEGGVVSLGHPDAPSGEVDPRARPFTLADVADVAAFDRARTGYDRSALLRELALGYAGTSWVVRDAGAVAGYVVGKPAWGGAEVGPLVADDAPTRRLLLDAALASLRGGPVDVAVPARQAADLAHLGSLGFERRFEAPAMYVGPAPPTRWSSVGAVGGLEKG